MHISAETARTLITPSTGLALTEAGTVSLNCTCINCHSLAGQLFSFETQQKRKSSKHILVALGLQKHLKVNLGCRWNLTIKSH